MTDFFDPLPWLIVLPLTWATLAFVRGPGRGSRLAIGAITLQCGLALQLQLFDQGARSYEVGGWGATLGISSRPVCWGDCWAPCSLASASRHACMRRRQAPRPLGET